MPQTEFAEFSKNVLLLSTEKAFADLDAIHNYLAFDKKEPAIARNLPEVLN